MPMQALNRTIRSCVLTIGAICGILLGCDGGTARSVYPLPPVIPYTESNAWVGGYVYRGLPGSPFKGSIILHQGHQKFASLLPVAARFQEAGFLVLGLEMPPIPPAHHGPLEQYFAATLEMLDILDDLGLTPVYMIGLSGGGWTTTVMTATDTRIHRGYSVAGDHPEVSYALGDWEQQQIDYRAMYALAGDRLQHVYIWADSCCFWGITGDIGTNYVTDYSVAEHVISEWTIQYILDDLRAVED